MGVEVLVEFLGAQAHVLSLLSAGGREGREGMGMGDVNSSMLVVATG